MNDPMGAIVGVLVVTMIIPAILMVIAACAAARRKKDLVLHGRTVTATITKIHSSADDGCFTTAEWINPQTGNTFSFTGRASVNDREGESIQIVVDPYSPHNHYFSRVTPDEVERQEKAYRDALESLDLLRSRYRPDVILTKQ